MTPTDEDIDSESQGDGAGIPLGRRYLIFERIGAGAMGQVFRATDRESGDDLAAKVLRPDLSADELVVKRFVNERILLMRLQSPHIVQVLDMVVEGDTLAIVMPRIKGGSLRDRIVAVGGELATDEAVGFSTQVFDALATAHDVGVVHRDVKPENVLIDRSGPSTVALVTDFGISGMVTDSTHTRLTSFVGTVGYMAPELLRGDVSATSAVDVYGAGVLLYELLCGHPPFTADDTLAVLYRHANEDPRRPDGIPNALWGVLERLLAKDPADRPSASDAVDMLRGLGLDAAADDPLKTRRHQRPVDPKVKAPPIPSPDDSVLDTPSDGLRLCPNGHRGREGAPFCDQCGERLVRGHPDDVHEETHEASLVSATYGLRKATDRVDRIRRNEVPGLHDARLSNVDLNAQAVPLPARLGIGPKVGIIGREVETTKLAEAFQRVAIGEGREVVMVCGEAGIGKTSLVAQFARSAFDLGALVLLGRCEQDLGAPYAPFIEALEHYVNHVDVGSLRQHVSGYGSELARMIPALAQRVAELPTLQSSDPDTERYLLYRAVVDLIATAASAQPVVLILDDLQWADKPSLQLLRYVATASHAMRILIAVTYRDSELSDVPPLVETLVALQREPNVSRIEIEGLTDSGVVAFMESAAGHELGDAEVALAHAVYLETDGNPFFVGEMWRHLLEVGAIHQDSAGHWSSVLDFKRIALPESVRQVIETRVARLGQGAKQALSLASVMGHDFDLELLALVSAHTEIEVLEVLEAAVHAGLVQELVEAPGRYSFSHALIQHTMYQALGSTRRSRVHRQVAEAIETVYRDDLDRHVGELAYHWSSAVQPVDVAKAISYTHRAATAALETMAPDEAVRYFSQALNLVEQYATTDPLVEVDLLIGLGNAQRQAGIPAYRETLLRAARRAQELGASDRLVEAALGNNRGQASAIGSTDTERVNVLQRALDVLPETDSPERAHLLAALCAELSYDSPLDQRRALAANAKAIGRRLGDPLVLVKVLNLVNYSLGVPWLSAERFDDSCEALQLAQEIGDPVQLFIAATYCRMNATQRGNFELARDCIGIEQRLADNLRLPGMVAALELHLAGDALICGDPERAERHANTFLQVGTETGWPDAFAVYGAHLVVIRLQQGRMGELVPLIDQVAGENPGIPAFRAALGVALVEAGEGEKARHLLEDSAEDGFLSVPEDTQWLDTLYAYADVAIELGVVHVAGQLLTLLAPYHEQIPMTAMPLPPVAFVLGGLASVTGSYDQAGAYFANATALSSKGKMRFAEARTQLAWARMMAQRRAHDDVKSACQLLEQARTTAAAHGYALVEKRAAVELSRLT